MAPDLPENKTFTFAEVRSWVAIIISFVALGVSVWQAWTTTLRPARIQGDLSYLIVWRFSSNNDGTVTDVALTPALWLQNVGARPVVVQDLRMVLTPKDPPERLLFFPVTSVPPAAIESSGEFNEYGRISAGSPFRSFSLTSSQIWVSACRFAGHSDSLRKLVGEVGAEVQVRTSQNSQWITVLSDSLDFGKMPYDERPMIGTAQSIPVYTHRWSLRTER